jgi:formylglycine-generating enzyme required for sulfatase activity
MPPVRGVVRDANGPEMIALNPGSFRMGNATGMTSGDDRPARDVSLAPFMIGAHEVTFAEYDRFVNATGARRPKDFGFGRGRQPVVDVTWEEARAYTLWLSRRTGKSYRLPTEAEWEYAARAGTRSMFWWGYDKLAGGAVCMDCGTRQVPSSPAPVGASGPNPFGLYDTAGNVYEWVADCYRPSYTGAPSDGSAVNEIGCRQRVARGGSFKTPASSARVDARRAFEPDTHINMLGFRVARDAR